MCFSQRVITKDGAKKFLKNPLIATRDIKVVKVLRRTSVANRYRSPYLGMAYRKGYHYTENMTGGSIRSTFPGGFIIYINQGLHCYSSTAARQVRYFLKEADIEVEMVIPKGSKYYKNQFGEMVTDNLIFY